MLAYRIQEQRLGGLGKAHRAMLTSGADASPALKTGTRLYRSCQGRSVNVELVEGGFLWGGEVRRSLSAIAKAVTGAHWSGPRFFGLNVRLESVTTTLCPLFIPRGPQAGRGGRIALCWRIIRETLPRCARG